MFFFLCSPNPATALIGCSSPHDPETDRKAVKHKFKNLQVFKQTLDNDPDQSVPVLRR